MARSTCARRSRGAGTAPQWATCASWSALTALMIGLGRSFAVYLYPEISVLVPYLIMVLVLLVRPEGLFGTPGARKI